MTRLFAKFRDLPLEIKLRLTVIALSALTLLMAGTAFLVNDHFSLKRNVREKLAALTEVVASNSTAALTFRDRAAAQEILSALEAERYIEEAVLYDGNGAAFALFRRRPSSNAEASGPLRHPAPDSMRSFVSGRQPATLAWTWPVFVSIVQPVVVDGERAGAIYVRYGLGEARLRTLSNLVITLGGFGTSLVLIYFLSARLIRPITGPVTELSKTMADISETKEYAVRLSPGSQDELGRLIMGFNDMLVQIDSRDRELEQHRNHLEDEVKRRTMELVDASEKALLMAEQAQAASRAKSAFLANMSHELRTPLNAVIGFSEVMIDQHFGPLNATQTEYMEDILNSGRHLLDLVQDILDLSKIEAGKMTLDLGDADIESLVHGSLVMVREKAMGHGIALSVDAKELPETLRVDERKMKQVLFNLLSNAVKFTPDGGRVSVTASIRNSRELQKSVPEPFRQRVLPVFNADRADYLHITVRDTGVGIKPEAILRIFEAFQQEDTSTTRRFGGTGLGLSLCSKIIDLHAGAIWAESEPGQGSTFTAIVPADGEIGFRKDITPDAEPEPSVKDPEAPLPEDGKTSIT